MVNFYAMATLRTKEVWKCSLAEETMIWGIPEIKVSTKTNKQNDISIKGILKTKEQRTCSRDNLSTELIQ